jgi:hypothetical protein
MIILAHKMLKNWPNFDVSGVHRFELLSPFFDILMEKGGSFGQLSIDKPSLDGITDAIA